jgi:hypothetical protein
MQNNANNATMQNNAVWPALMTVPHPAVVHSLGPECVQWCADNLGMRMRWWQRLVLGRVLEVDAAGRLVWLNVVLSMPRQVGKSWLLRGLAMWRLHQAARFGEEQTVMHIANGLSASREVQRQSRLWARARREQGYNAREQNGAQEVSTPDGSRWLIRPQDGAYSFSAGLAIVDEAWGVAASHVNEGLEPTLPERVCPQLVVVSTAHPRPTGLVPSRRRAALAQLGDPADSLLVEWSAPVDVELSVGAARDCSPFWGPGREAVARSAFDRIGVTSPADTENPADAFDTQWLNRWPGKAYTPSRDFALVDAAAWAGAADLGASPAGPVVVAVDDRTGDGAAAAAAGMSGDGRVIVWGQLFPTRAHAGAWAAFVCESRPGSRIVVGAALAGDDAFRGAARVSSADSLASWPKLREALTSGRLAHDGGADLSAQILSARVAERAGGLAVTSRARSDLARCASWAVAAAAAAPAPKPRWAMV